MALETIEHFYNRQLSQVHLLTELVEPEFPYVLATANRSREQTYSEVIDQRASNSSNLAPAP